MPIAGISIYSLLRTQGIGYVPERGAVELHDPDREHRPAAYTDLSPARIREVVELKLALVGMAGFKEL